MPVMNPVTHFLAGWLVANTAELKNRDRILITLAGVIPDLDGIGIVMDIIKRNPATKLDWWSTYHHVLGHNILFALIVAGLSAVFALRKGITVFLVFISFHVHLLGDILGARGPDFQWPIPYLLPFSNAWQITWSGQWMLNSWQNFVITGGLLLMMFCLAWKRGYSPVGIFSQKADETFVQALRNRFGIPSQKASS